MARALNAWSGERGNVFNHITAFICSSFEPQRCVILLSTHWSLENLGAILKLQFHSSFTEWYFKITV